MNKILRVISTILIAAGFGGVYLFTRAVQNQHFQPLGQPSYYTMRDHRLLFIASILAVFAAVLCSFFSWFKTLDTQSRILDNAISADQDTIAGWVDGSTLDKTRKTEQEIELLGEAETELLKPEQETVLLGEAETELLKPEQETVLLEEEDDTVLLTDVSRLGYLKEEEGEE